MKLPRSLYAVTSASLIAATLWTAPVAALAAWDAGTAEAVAGARAGELPAVVVPVVTAHGSSVRVDWPAITVPPGVGVRGYRVSRTDATTGVSVAVGGGCAGVLTRTRCVEGNVPQGLWAYGVVALVGDAWRSAPGVAAPLPLGKPGTVPPTSPPAPTPPAPTPPAPTPPAPTPPAPAPIIPTAPAPSTSAPTAPAASTPAPTSTPPGPAPTSTPVGPAPTASTAPSVELTKAPAPSAKPTSSARASSAEPSVSAKPTPSAGTGPLAVSLTRQ
ncbi:hypothetical protein [Actinoplanes sp. M2I2]|uniref:hypothetical protein n=1 Tax=Actinoplanes sp. M2I2 TaxID=1734444 RepID=UPI0020214F48|nr:hypothetical protein [Actinoplanes sp. M2I2]